MATRKKGVINIPLVEVPKEMWDEMLERAGGDPVFAQEIWSSWKFYEESENDSYTS